MMAQEYNVTFQLDESFENVLLTCKILRLPQTLINALYALQCRKKLVVK
jgi:hypothetical protein